MIKEVADWQNVYAFCMLILAMCFTINIKGGQKKEKKLLGMKHNELFIIFAKIIL